jgi:hypothetical protein
MQVFIGSFLMHKNSAYKAFQQTKLSISKIREPFIVEET